jgi:hypothetical protein
MYTIANKHNKKTRKISSSSTNKHKSKSKNKHKHKYTIGKTRKYTKSYFNLQYGGVHPKPGASATPGALDTKPLTQTTPAALRTLSYDDIPASPEARRLADTFTRSAAAAPTARRPADALTRSAPLVSKTTLSARVTEPRTQLSASVSKRNELQASVKPHVTFDDFKAKIRQLFENFTPDSSDSKYTPDKLFVDLTIAATSITAPDQQKKALNIIQTMYIFYSNHFPKQNSRLVVTLKRKFGTITLTPLTAKPTLLTTDLGQELSNAIYDKLTAAAKKHTVHTTPTLNDTQTSSLSSSWENTPPLAAPRPRANREPPGTEMQTLLTPPAAIRDLKEWNEGQANTVMVAKNSKLGNSGLPEPPSKFENGYTILFHQDGIKFAWGKKRENILKRLNGQGDHPEQRIVFKNITKIIPDNTTNAPNDTCRSSSISTSISKNCVTIIQYDANNPVWFFSFDSLQTRDSFIELIQKLMPTQMH